MGGPEALAKFKASGRLNARERIAACWMTAASVNSAAWPARATTAAMAHSSASTRPTPSPAPAASKDARWRLHVDDFTIRAGSSEATIADKWIYIERLAHQLRLPLIRLVDSAGGSVKLLMQIGGTKIPEYPSWPANELLQTVPVVGVALGACAGQGAIKVLSSHFSVMVREQAQVMAAGPARGAPGLWHRMSTRTTWAAPGAPQERAGAQRSGGRADALAQVRRFLSYLPRSVFHTAPVCPTHRRPEPGRRLAERRHPARPPQDL
jgi:acetyl-CoA carboxylase carboxyltransferase component